MEDETRIRSRPVVAAFRVCLLAGVVGHVRVHLAGLGVLLLNGPLLVLGYLRLLLGIGIVTAGNRSFVLSRGLPAKRVIGAAPPVSACRPSLGRAFEGSCRVRRRATRSR